MWAKGVGVVLKLMEQLRVPKLLKPLEVWEMKVSELEKMSPKDPNLL